MVFENINSLNTDMIIGKDIIDTETNRVLLKSGTRLTPKYISYLKEHGYKGIYVESEKYKNIIVDDIISDEVKNGSLKALRNLDVSSVMENARKMVTEIVNKTNISFDNLNLKSDDYEHSLRVAEMSIVIGKAMGLKESELVDLAGASLLHDVGKQLKDPQALKKLGFDGAKGSYQEELYPLYGYRLIQNNSDVKSTVKVGVLTHNMNIDGSNNIDTGHKLVQHIFGKIIHVTDSYDQVISDKYDDKVASPSEALEFLLGGCGTKFDQSIVQAFQKYIPVYPKGTKVLLSNGLIGVVLKNNDDIPLRPHLVLENGKVINLAEFKFNNITIINQTEEYKKNATL